MNELTKQIFGISPHGFFTSQETATLFPGSADRRYGLVKRALAGGEIIQIRRGLYRLAPKYQNMCMSTGRTGLDWTGLVQCSEDLRIEPEEFKAVSVDEIDLLLGNYASQRVQIFLTGVRRELGQ